MEQVAQCEVFSAELSLALSHFHRGIETARWRDQVPRQRLLPLCRDTAATHIHSVTGFHPDSFSVFLIESSFPSPSVWTVPAHEGPHREDIFADELHSQFATKITRMLQFWKPKLLRSGMIPDTLILNYLFPFRNNLLMYKCMLLVAPFSCWIHITQSFESIPI